LADGTLSDEGELQLAGMLRADAVARRQYRQFLALHGDLHWDYAAAVVAQPEKRIEVRPERPGWKWRAWHRWAVAVLLLVLVAGGLLLHRRGKVAPDGERPVIGRLSPLAGEVQVAAGEEGRAISQESNVPPGAAIHVVGLTGLAALRLDDGTQISLGGETRIECRRDAGQTTITLHEGYLSANVMPQAAGHPLLIRTASAEMRVLGTRLAVSADHETAELGVQHGRVNLKRLTDGETLDVGSGQCAVVSSRTALEARPWPSTPDTWQEDFERGLPDGWRYGQWSREEGLEGPRGVVRAARRFALDSSDSRLHRITLPKRWMQGLWRLQGDTYLHFTYKMSHPGWFHIMMGARSDDLNPSHIGNYELQSGYWKTGEPNQWQTVSVPFSVFRKNLRGVPYADLPLTAPRAGDVVYLLWFNTGDVDRGLVIDRIRIDRSSQPSEESL
jgi:ferric-dicitrate binding protein FerR (iron transport regulator)